MPFLDDNVRIRAWALRHHFWLREDAATRMEDSAPPLAFGMPSAPRAPIINRERLSSVRRRADASELGDFVSLSDSSGFGRGGRLSTGPTGTRLSFGSAGTRLSFGSAGTPLSNRHEEPEPTAWSATRRYHGDSAMLQLHEDLLDFHEAYRPTVTEQAARERGELRTAPSHYHATAPPRPCR